ncbi:MAG TPA: UbiA family prenyltransferase [Pirellulales bacterium]|nr:UbiA family prenyltransferase [Pirellulales bacterium]
MAASASPSRVRAFLELLRFPNVFTALADVAMGFLFTHLTAQPAGSFVLLAVASVCLYLAGMVLNDYFDRDVDFEERPARPIPSGRISASFARVLGFGLLVAGVAAGWTAGMLEATARSGIVATLLAACVVSYDALLKRTPLGPLAMGSCRMLNVLMGMSGGAGPFVAIHWVVALGVGIYIAGVTWFARTEATESHRAPLAAALLVMLAGIAVLAWYPQWAADDVPEFSRPIYALRTGDRWYWFWGLMAVMVGWRGLRAVIDPLPVYVQGAVKQCLISLIVLDAAVCMGVRGAFYAACIVALVVPTMFLGRWIYST